MQAQGVLLSIIDQVNHVLQQLEPDAYKKPLPEYNGSSLGQHFRHILEFFQCLENGAMTGLVDYAGRERNLLYEDNPKLTIEAFNVLVPVLLELPLSKKVLVRAEFGSDERPDFESSVGRELVFVYDHAIHHLAIIKIGLHCHFPEVNADPDLGVSPSTIKHRKAMSQ